MEPEVRKVKLDWADGLRLFAACSVIFLHVAATGVLHYGQISMANWWTCNLYDSAVRSCVPLFLMLTGALLMPRETSLTQFLSKRMTRLLFPAAFWSVIYLAYHYFLRDTGAPRGLAPTIKWLYGTMQQKPEFHFWYLYEIVGIAAFLPLFGRAVRAATDQELFYYLSIWATTLFGNYPSIGQYAIHIDLVYFSGYLGYLVAGYAIATRQIKLNKSLVVLAIAIGYLFTVWQTYHATAAGHFIETFYNPLAPNVAIMALGIFYLFRYANLKPITGLGAIIQQNSYNIFFAHILVLLLLARVGITEFIMNPVVGVPLLSLACLAICIVLALGIRKSFLGKYIAG
jgi:surface polysaccharide O-acyltransferase-like enzyme